MGKLKNFLIKNRKLSYTMFFVWLSACVFAIYYGAFTNGDNLDSLCEYVRKATQSKISISSVINNAFITNLQFGCLILVISTTVLLLPAAIILCALKGFACGITSAILFRTYGEGAIVPVIFAVVMPQLAYLPIYITMFVMSIKYPIGRIKADKLETASKKRKEWMSFAVLQLIFVLILSCISVAESLILKLMYAIMN